MDDDDDEMYVADEDNDVDAIVMDDDVSFIAATPTSVLQQIKYKLINKPKYKFKQIMF